MGGRLLRLGLVAIATTMIPFACSEFEESPPATPEGGAPDGPGAADGGTDRALPPIVPSIVVTATSSAPRVLVGESVEVTITVKRDGEDAFKGPVHIEMAPVADVAATGLDIPAEAATGKTTLVFTAKRKHGRLPLVFKATSAGSPSTGEARISIVARGSAGSLDNGFGTDGVFSLGTPSKATGIALVAGYRIVLGGSIGSQAAVLRINEDGSPDTTFGTQGRFTKSLTAMESTGDVAVDPMGNAYLVVSADVGFGQNAVVMKVAPNGTLSSAFGTQGLARTTGFRGAAVAWSAKGIFVGGKATAGEGLGFVALLKPDGSGLVPGSDFRTIGASIGSCAPPGDSCYVRSITIGPNDVPLYAAASGNNGCEVFNGTSSFDTSGSLSLTFCQAVVPDAQQRVYVGGYGGSCGARVFRYLSDGSPDEEWNGDEFDGGCAPGERWRGAIAQRFVRQTDGTTVAVGTPAINGQKVLGAWRMKADGKPDTSLSPDGALYKSVGATNVTVQSMVIDGEGRIVILGSNGEMVAVRFWQ